ncbi:hypothetical protein [Leifsonia sp. RAF41]|uniref:hypothetical protein n=1 Tax=Leifsonia sp. RAF41 TaxID=3233056 RepID=UPI003F99B9B1
MKKIVRMITGAAAAVGIILGVGFVTAAPASAAGSDCQTLSVGETPGGYLATILCSETLDGWLDNNLPTRSYYKGVGNTPGDALSNATWMAYNSNSASSCHDVSTAAVPGGYNVVYTCTGRLTYPNAAAADLNTAVSWANYQFVLYR